ncbi:biotin carboxylase N-terminal domain-containing protein [Arthrobacter sp. NPDC093128]|uniref:acetyl-CoA carboxylase biotin carboxylase subunit n=1 Tax=Arthrobacter sp. NPDC093128 TaxID=3154979 RepID=UPI003432863C
MNTVEHGAALPAKVLIANRGEIAVRIARTCRDVGVKSVGIYSAEDRDALHVRTVDEAFALEGSTPAQTYLDIDQIIRLALRCGADSVHPGYGFLAESAELAEAVIANGLLWIGPPPQAIRLLGDKVQARHIALKVGAPLAPGSPDPVENAAEVEKFANEYGLPIAIKAAFGGGGRGLKVVRDAGEIQASFESAVREATVAFGRGECFVEKFLDKPRHVETQCLADTHGNVVVVSTRDCSMQRRHQKLVEEAPAPDLTPQQLDQITTASTAILKEAGYVGAGTCEFLIADDIVSFLEVNTRIQVEHPVTEEITGVDLIHQMLLIAKGARISEIAPEARGCSMEFRINAENVGAGFIPSPGTITRLVWPDGPGIRVDSGFEGGNTIPRIYDSLLAKLIITAPNREMALRRARRALAGTVIEGVPTTIDFHKQIVEEQIFTSSAPYLAYTGWIDDEFRYRGQEHGIAGRSLAADQELEILTVEVDGRRLTVRMPKSAQPDLAAPRTRNRRPSKEKAAAAIPGGITVPMTGTVVKVLAEEGRRVKKGETVLVVEAMKMEQALDAPFTGTVERMSVRAGEKVNSGDVAYVLRAEQD